MQSFVHFLTWHSKEDIVPTLGELQEKIDFYHNKGTDLLKLGCTLLKLAEIWLLKAIVSNFYPFIETDKGLLEKFETIGGQSNVFTRKALVDEIFIRKSMNQCKSIVGFDASQLYPNPMCQPMPTEFLTRWEYESEIQHFTPGLNKSRSSDKLFLWYSQQFPSDSEKESNVTTGRSKKNDCFSVDELCNLWNIVFEAMGWYYHYWLRQ